MIKIFSHPSIFILCLSIVGCGGNKNPNPDQTAAENAVNGGGSGGSVNPSSLFSWTAAGTRGQL